MVVFHELVHAHLQQTGVSQQLQKSLGDPAFLRAEEALVVGLKDGEVDARGVYFPENTYRLMSDQDLRATHVRFSHVQPGPAVRTSRGARRARGWSVNV